MNAPEVSGRGQIITCPTCLRRFVVDADPQFRTPRLEHDGDGIKGHRVIYGGAS